MNYMMETATDMRPSVPVERENMKTIMGMTNARLNDAVEKAEKILAEIRGATPMKGDEPRNCISMIDAQHMNLELSERICAVLTEIAGNLGVDA